MQMVRSGVDKILFLYIIIFKEKIMENGKVILEMAKHFNKVYNLIFDETDCELFQSLKMQNETLIEDETLRSYMKAYNHLNSLIGEINEIFEDNKELAEDCRILGRKIASLRLGLKRILNKDFNVDLFLNRDNGRIECIK